MATAIQRKWNAPEYREAQDGHATLDRDIVQAQASGSIGGDLRPGVRDRQEKYLPVLRAKYQRCPTCGGKVIMPCRLCRISDIIILPGEFDRLVAEVPKLEEQEAIKSERNRRARSKRTVS